MRRSALIAIVIVPVAMSLAAASPLPEEIRLPARVVRTIAAPPTDGLNMPTDVAVDSRGIVAVADGVHHRVVRFDENGEVISKITAAGGAPLHESVGVTFDAKDRLWIADTGSARLLVISPDGEFVEQVDVPAAPGGRAADVTDVLVASDGKRTYVVDNDNHRLLIRDNTNDTWQVFGRRGEALGQFDYPFMIAADPEGAIYITDVINGRIQSLAADDEWRGQIGRWGVEAGKLYRPKGVAVDSAGRIFVGDSTLGVVQAFAPNGRLAGVLTNEDGEPLRFAHPMGLCFDSAGLLYVVELDQNRVAVVEIHVPKPVEPAIGRGQIGGESKP